MLQFSGTMERSIIFWYHFEESADHHLPSPNKKENEEYGKQNPLPYNSGVRSEQNFNEKTSMACLTWLGFLNHFIWFKIIAGKGPLNYGQ